MILFFRKGQADEDSQECRRKFTGGFGIQNGRQLVRVENPGEGEDVLRRFGRVRGYRREGWGLEEQAAKDVQQAPGSVGGRRANQTRFRQKQEVRQEGKQKGNFEQEKQEVWQEEKDHQQKGVEEKGWQEEGSGRAGSDRQVQNLQTLAEIKGQESGESRKFDQESQSVSQDQHGQELDLRLEEQAWIAGQHRITPLWFVLCGFKGLVNGFIRPLVFLPEGDIYAANYYHQTVRV